MKDLKSLLSAAAVTSLLAGILLTLVQQSQVIPLIEKAEVLESKQAHHHDVAGEDHDHIWMPQQGVERQLYTALSNVVIALGFTLLMAAGVQLTRGKLNWKQGLLWGLSGFTVFFLAPAFSMTPELPGMESIDLGQRQLWWLMVSASTAVGLALMVFGRRWLARMLGFMLLIIPHIIGAPEHAAETNVPLDLLEAFLLASLFANAMFWLAMGGFYGYFHSKMVQK